MSRWVPVLILAIAAVLRFYALDLKPPHFDEGVNGWFIDQMTRSGYFEYDPNNYHGPLHFYVLFISQTLFGRNLLALRVPLVLTSLATVWLILRFDRFLDRRICWLAAATFAVSPAFTFYARYAIHESELVFFLVLLVFGGAGLWRSGERKYLWATGLAITGMILTKETYLVHFVCFALAGVALRVLELMSPSSGDWNRGRQLWGTRDLLAVTSVSVIAIVFFYSGGFMKFSVLKGLYQTFAAWAETGKEGHGHEKDWWYWLDLMRRYELPSLLGLIAAVSCVRPGTDRLLRYLSIYGIGTLVAYSIVSYKTPWCIISLLWPFLFTFGSIPFFQPDRAWKLGTVGASLALLGFSTFQSLKLNFRNYTNDSEPYVYVQTFDDINKLTAPLSALTREDPRNFQIVGHMLIGSYHPLPWVLGDFQRIGYYGTDKSPPEFDADFLIVDNTRVAEVEKQLHKPYFKEPFNLRSAQAPATLYLNAMTFLSVYPDRTPEFMPEEETQ